MGRIQLAGSAFLAPQSQWDVRSVVQAVIGRSRKCVALPQMTYCAAVSGDTAVNTCMAVCSCTRSENIQTKASLPWMALRLLAIQLA